MSHCQVDMQTVVGGGSGDVVQRLRLSVAGAAGSSWEDATINITINEILKW